METRVHAAHVVNWHNLVDFAACMQFDIDGDSNVRFSILEARALR